MAPLAEIRDYDSLHRALRDRAQSLQVSMATIDEVAGLADGHASALLGPRPRVRFGMVTLGLVLQGLGLKLMLVEDEPQMAKIKSRLVPREVEVPVRAVRCGPG